MENIINIDESRIRFKAFLFFPQPGNEAISINASLNYLGKLSPKDTTNIYIKRKRINEAVANEFKIIDGVRVDLLTEYSVKGEDGKPLMNEKNNFTLPESGTTEYTELMKKYEDLMNQEIVLPHSRFKKGDFNSIEKTIELYQWSMETLDLLSIFVEIAEEPQTEA
jgi:hypothetical protein